MQKVSKQSLAMIALSILLAISIALTFTFAAAQASKTATGTITFSGNVAITMGDGFTKNTETYEFTLNEVDNAVNLDDNLTIGVSGTDAYVKIVVGAPTGSNLNAVTIAAASAVAEESSLYNNEGTTFTSKTKIKAGTSVKLSDLINITLDLNKLADNSSVTFTITVDANVSKTELN